MKLLILAGLVIVGLIEGCASTTEEGAVGVQRRQFISDSVLSADQVNQMSFKGYSEMKQDASKKGELDRDPAQVQRVTRITQRLISHVTVFRKDAAGWPWESHVITNKDINAFCMPGGKMIMYTGLMDGLKLTDAEIAAVMGHEIAHALREHGRERMTQEAAKQGGLEAVMAMTGVDPKYGGIINAGASVLISLPYGRTQELESDHIGLELMARAGYNPEEAVTLWEKMGQAGGGAKPPEFISTHPSDGRRAAEIRALLPKVMPLYQAAAKP